LFHIHDSASEIVRSFLARRRARSRARVAASLDRVVAPSSTPRASSRRRRAPDIVERRAVDQCRARATRRHAALAARGARARALRARRAVRDDARVRPQPSSGIDGVSVRGAGAMIDAKRRAEFRVAFQTTDDDDDDDDAQTLRADDTVNCDAMDVVVHARFVLREGTDVEGTLRDARGAEAARWTFDERRSDGDADDRGRAKEIEVKTRGCGDYEVCFHHARGKSKEARIEVDYFQALREPSANGDDVEARIEDESEKAKRERAKRSTSEGLRTDGVLSVSSKASGLNNWVQQLREEMNYLRVRAERHKKTVESNARRMVRTTFIEVCVLIGVTGVQVMTVKRFFDVQTRSHERFRTQFGGASSAFAGGFEAASRHVAGPMADAFSSGANAAQRGVAGLLKSIGRSSAPSRARHDYHLG
jgi:hypothetical protein